MAPSRFLYESIFMYGSLQFCGNIEQYFSKKARKLVMFLVLPRGDIHASLIRLYTQGRLASETPVYLPKNIFLYYVTWYLTYLKIIAAKYARSERFVVLSGHPISFFFMSLQKIIRPSMIFGYWVGDFFPPVNASLILYEKLKKWYHDRIPFAWYLSDRINEKMNGVVCETQNRRTCMWGIAPLPSFPQRNRKKDDQITLCFVGVMREDHGVLDLLEKASTMPKVMIKLLGPCSESLAKRINQMILKYHLEKRVVFPNTSIYGEELLSELRSSDIGVALYTDGKDTAAYYADPAKIKTYTQAGLPVITTDATAIAPYIKEFKAGEIVTTQKESFVVAVNTIVSNMKAYRKGVDAFNQFFRYDTYYRERFAILETVWK